MTMTTKPDLQHAFDLSIRVGPPLEVGEVGWGQRRIINVLGGEVRGPGMNGRVTPGGADYQIIRASGLTELHARYTFELDGGAVVYVENTGLRFGPAEALDRLRRGEPVDPALIYFRTAPRFETASPSHQWLVTHLFVGVGQRYPDRVDLAVYQLL